MTTKDNTVQCATHGVTTATYVCKHLLSGHSKGFHCGYDDNEPDEKWPDAWCDDCQQTLEHHGEWNESSASEADIQVVCSSCYEGLRDKHWQQDDELVNKHLNVCDNYLSKKQTKFIKKFSINKYAQWQCFAEQRRLIFSHDNIPQVEAQIDIVGDFDQNTGRWLWAWANEELPEHVKKASQIVRSMGEKTQDLHLCSATWISTEQESQQMTAVMAKELRAIGFFQIPTDHGLQYMVIHTAKNLTEETSSLSFNAIFSRLKNLKWPLK